MEGAAREHPTLPTVEYTVLHVWAVLLQGCAARFAHKPQKLMVYIVVNHGGHHLSPT